METLGNIFKYADDMKKCQNLSEIFDLLETQINFLGYDFFAFQAFQKNGVQPIDELTSYPEEWVYRYKEKSYSKHDLVASHATSAVGPFLWTDVGNISDFSWEQKTVFNEASEFGLKSGGAVPLYGPNTQYGLFAVATKMAPNEFEKFFIGWRQHELALVAGCAYDRMFKIDCLPNKPQDNILSPREQQVLVWLARGKSTLDVSEILGIAEQTVRHHIKNSITKLNAFNKTHAIVMAQELGFIQVTQ